MSLLCRIFGHKAEKNFQPAVGGRNVKRCTRCPHICEEQLVTQREAERYAPHHRPTGKISDTYPS